MTCPRRVVPSTTCLHPRRCMQRCYALVRLRSCRPPSTRARVLVFPRGWAPKHWRALHRVGRDLEVVDEDGHRRGAPLHPPGTPGWCGDAPLRVEGSSMAALNDDDWSNGLSLCTLSIPG
jgi:hypothetical protein